MVPKMDSLPLRHFRLPPTQLLPVALVDLTDRYLRAWEPVPPCPQFDHYTCFPASSLLLPLPTAAFFTIMAKRNAAAEELLPQAESNGYNRGEQDTQLHVVLPVSILQAEQIRLTCFLLEKVRCVHQRYIVSHGFKYRTRDPSRGMIDLTFDVENSCSEVMRLIIDRPSTRRG